MMKLCMGRCETGDYDVSRVVAEQVTIEAVVPPRRSFTALGESVKGFVEIPPYIVTLPVVIIACLFCNQLIFNYEYTGKQDCQLF